MSPSSRRRIVPLALIAVLAGVGVAVFGLRAGHPPAPASAAPAGRAIPHARGSTVVPEHPKTVLVFDLAALDTLDALGVEPSGVAGELFPGALAKFADAKKYPRVGTLFEPDYEAVHAARPDLIITGGRTSAKYDKLAALAPTVDQTTDDAHFLATVEANTRRLGSVFGREAKATELLQGMRQDIATLKATASQRGKGLIVLTSGGKMSAYGPGSRFGMIHEDLGVPPAAPSLKASLHGEAISAEFLLETNPDWLFVIDRDAAIGEGGGARRLLDNDLVRQTTAWKQGQVVYLDPVNTYLIGGGVQAVRRLMAQLSDAYARQPTAPERAGLARPASRGPVVPAMPTPDSPPRPEHAGFARPAPRVSGLLVAGLAVLGLALLSLRIGVSHLSWDALTSSEPGARAVQVLLLSRVPRTLALVLSGMSLAVAGLLMQLLARNRFVEPFTAGTAESASLGILTVTVLAPGLPLPLRTLVAALFALAGTALFLLILRRVPLRSALVVPLVGLVLGAVLDSLTTFLAQRFSLLQSLASWTTGDFSGVMSGRYEWLWGTFALTVVAYVAADRFTVAGLGESFTTNLGLNHRRIVALGLTLVALVTAVVVATVGMIPFIGLVVPNLVGLLLGDNARRTLPWVAAAGAGFVLLCDIVGRVVRHPHEIPVGTVAGVVGSLVFLHLLLRRDARVG